MIELYYFLLIRVVQRRRVIIRKNCLTAAHCNHVSDQLRSTDLRTILPTGFDNRIFRPFHFRSILNLYWMLFMQISTDLFALHVLASVFDRLANAFSSLRTRPLFAVSMRWSRYQISSLERYYRRKAHCATVFKIWKQQFQILLHQRNLLSCAEIQKNTQLGIFRYGDMDAN